MHLGCIVWQQDTCVRVMRLEASFTPSFKAFSGRESHLPRLVIGTDDLVLSLKY